MANCYHVDYQGRRLAEAHVSPHPHYQGRLTISLIPAEPALSSADACLKKALYGHFADSKPVVEAILEMLAAAGVATGHVSVAP